MHYQGAAQRKWERAGEMVLQGKLLPCKGKDQSSSPQYPCKLWGAMVAHLQYWHSEGKDRGSPELIITVAFGTDNMLEN